MRVLSVIETLRHGGAETVLVDLVAGLTAHDHCIVHFSAVNGEVIHPWIDEALARRSVPCLDLDWRALHGPDTRRAALGGFEPDVVLYHWWGQDSLRPWLIEAQALAESRRPFFVLVAHRSEVPVQPGFDAYVLVSASQRPQVAAIDPARVHVIPNGVDLARFPRRGPRQADAPFTVGRLSNLRHGKIPPDWVTTAAAYDLPGAHFVIPGEGPLRAEFESDIRSLGLESRFSLPGYVPRANVPDLLATFDVFCHVTSTAIECHPLALLEAAAAGVPIVAEARGGIPDIVSHGESGLLAQSSAEVGAHLRLLRRDGALRARLSEGARQMAARYTLERQLQRYADLLESADRQRRPAARSVATARPG